MNNRKLGRGVAVVGAGMSKFGCFPGYTSRDIFVDAYKDLLSTIDKGIDPQLIEAFYLGNYSSDLFEGQAHLAPIIANWIGLSPIPAVRVENACASSSVAFREALIAIASGLYDVVLVGGIEKMTDLPISAVTDTLATAADIPYEVNAGFTFPGFYASMATAYMHEYGATPETFMKVTLKNHFNGSLNPKAQFGQKISEIMEIKKASAANKERPIPKWQDEMEFLADDKANPVIAWPMRLYDCSPVSDGGAALLLVSEEIAYQFTDNPIFVIGSGAASDGPLHSRSSLTSIPSAKLASQKAYDMASITAADVKLSEVHDCFTIAEIIATEDLGFFAEGKGGVAAEEGLTSRTGLKPINTSGGLKSKGHPVGASGAGQVVEIWKQLRGEAGDRQMPGNPDLGLTHNVGGTGQTCIVNIFERR